MSYRETEHLRVLIANERKDRLALVAPIVAALGHEVIAREIEVADVGAVTARERPDVALVGLGESSDHALGLIEKIVQEAACPVIVLIHARDPAFVKEASKRGVFAYISDADVENWQARSTSCFDASPSTTTSKARSGVAHSSSVPGHPDGTPLHRRGERLRDAARALAHRQPQARRHRHRCRRRPPAASEAAAGAVVEATLRRERRPLDVEGCGRAEARAFRRPPSSPISRSGYIGVSLRKAPPA